MRLLKSEVVQSSVEDVCAEELDVPEMEKGIRKTGIAIIGDASWGTHFCQFYQTKEDLIDVLVPYFKAGLESNEFCMWVTSEPLGEEEAKEAMRKAVPDFDRYVERGQIEIVPHTEWYLKDGAFNLQRVLNAWIDKLDQALAKGYDGIRVTGNTAWLEKKEWKNFVEYEEEVNDAIGKHQMIAICTYSLDKCGASEVIDVVRNHQFALVRRRGEWELIESSELKRAKEVLRESEEKYRNLVNNSNDIVITADESANWTFLNPAVKRILGYEPAEMIGKSAFDFMLPEDIASTRKAHESVIREDRRFWEYENRWISKDGRVITLAWNVVALRDEQGNIIGTQGVGRDITEKKKAEEKLRFLKEFNERVVDSIGDALLVIDPYDYTIVSANEAALKQLKSRKEDLVGKTCYETTHHSSTPCRPPHDICPIQEMLETGKAVRVEHKHFDRDNNEMCVEVSASPVRSHEGKIVQVVHLSRDITERKKAEERLRESEERYRVLVESAADAIFTLNEAGDFLSANQEAARNMGKTPEDMIGKNMYDLFPKDIADSQMSDVKALFQTGKPLLAYEAMTQTRFGQKWYSTTLMPVRDSNGKIIYAMGIARDITERKKMEAALKRQRDIAITLSGAGDLSEVLNRLFDILLEIEEFDCAGFYLVDRDTGALDMIVYRGLPDGFVEKGGHLEADSPYAKVVMEGKPICQKTSDFPPAIREDLQSDGILAVAAIPIHYKGEAIGDFNLASHTHEEISASTRHVLESVGAQIGETIVRARMEEELRQYSENLEAMVEERTRKLKKTQEQLIKSERLAAIGEVATMVGHDLRNPLQSIENATYYLNNELPRLSPSVPIPQKAMEMLHIISDSVDYADKIIRDLQDFSATKKPILKKTDVNAMVMETLSRVKAPENVRIITELDRLPEIKADKGMMRRVFLNLTTNGIQAMKKRGRLKVSTKKTEGFVEVSFEDTGVGMSEENMKKLFTPFFTTKAKGMGMGLPICKRFVAAHGGSIQVESKEGEGSTFTVKLPIQPIQMEVKNIAEK